jgi:hypothetical protein
MIFGITILVLILAIAYFHYIQGFFRSMISMVLAVLAALLAVGYHENVAQLAFHSFGVAQGYSVSLIGLFVIIYLTLRLAFDKFIPGNIQLPVLADKIGAGVCGVVAGIFAAGVLAVAAQALPLGPSVAGYSRFPLSQRTTDSVRVPGKSQLQNLELFDELTVGSMDPARASGLLIPADDILIGTVSCVSTGALANDRPFSAIHPDYLDELFGQRLGIDPAANRVMIDGANSSALKVEKVVALSAAARGSLTVKDFEIEGIRGKDSSTGKSRLDLTAWPEGDMFIVRVKPDGEQADKKDSLMRFSCAAVRLVAGARDHEKNYHPVGTLSGERTLLRNLPDDPLFLAAGKAVDLVFIVPSENLSADPQKAISAPGAKVAPGVFIEFKRMAHADLSGMAPETELPAGADVGVMEKEAPRPY